MSLSKVTSDNGSSLARFTADHAAVPFLGAPLPNSPDGSKDYVWAAVHILGVAIVAGSKSFACGPLDRTRDLPEGTEHVRMSEGEHVVLHVALRAAAIKMSEEFDQAALGTFDFSKFP